MARGNRIHGKLKETTIKTKWMDYWEIPLDEWTQGAKEKRETIGEITKWGPKEQWSINIGAHWCCGAI